MAKVPKRILVVDDNDLIRTLLTQTLEHAGYETIAAESAEAALVVASADPPDLCVVDQIMPGMSGAELIRLLRDSPDERLRRIPTIGLSGWASADAELLAAGARAAIRKPCGATKLLENVRVAIG